MSILFISLELIKYLILLQSFFFHKTQTLFFIKVYSGEESNMGGKKSFEALTQS